MGLLCYFSPRGSGGSGTASSPLAMGMVDRLEPGDPVRLGTAASSGVTRESEG
jgi:hypothetical protein